MKPNTMLLSSVLAVVGFTMSVPAFGQMVSPRNPRAIASILEAAGLPAKIVTKAGENPSIESKHGRLVFSIFFMTCNDVNQNCKTIQYYIGYSDAKSVSYERLNTWNKDHRFARAYKDNDGDPVLEMDIDLDFDGLPRKNVEESLRTWLSLVDQYQAFLFPPAKK